MQITYDVSVTEMDQEIAAMVEQIEAEFAKKILHLVDVDMEDIKDWKFSLRVDNGVYSVYATDNR